MPNAYKTRYHPLQRGMKYIMHPTAPLADQRHSIYSARMAQGWKTIRNRLFALTHPGERFHCLFCGYHGGRFLAAGSRSARMQALGAVGIGRRANARCPRCGSSDRARLLMLYFRHRTDLLTAPQRVLHMAPDAHVARALKACPTLDYTCGSIVPTDFAEFEAIKVDVTAIPFPDAAFDVVICNRVLQQVPDDRKGRAELLRVLKPGGWALIQAPVAMGLDTTDEDMTIDSPSERRARFGAHLHFRLYGRDYARVLESAGFRVNATSLSQDRWVHNAEQQAVNPDERLYVATRPRQDQEASGA